MIGSLSRGFVITVDSAIGGEKMDILLFNNLSAPGQTAGPDPVEALQTDVMRFMAILGLCLVVVFSLVQSLPLVSRPEQPKVVDKNLLTQEVSMLEEKAQRLRVEVEKLEASSETAKHAFSDTQSRLDSMMGEIERSTEVLADLRRQIGEGKSSLAELSRRLEKEREKLIRLELKIAPSSEKPVPEPGDPAKQDSSSSAKKTAEREGFTLSFQTGEALFKLVEQGRVQFFALTGRKSWKLGIRKGAPIFEPSSVPSKIYEMQPATVPEAFLPSLQKVVSIPGRDMVTWGVVLPMETQNQIHYYMADRSGGSLVIQGDGQVMVSK